MASSRFLRAFCVALAGCCCALPLLVRPAAAAAPTNPACITDSTLITVIDSQPCGKFQSIVSRTETIGAIETDIVAEWMVHKPKGKPKGLAVLLMGGAGNAKIEKGPKRSVLPGVSSNFLVRSAQLFAEAGYLTVTVDGPEDSVSTQLYGADNATFDAYRVSPKATQDLAAVIAKANGSKNLPVFLVGTSRGANFAAAKHPLAVGVALSSPVTTASGGSPVYVDLATAAAISTPSHVLSNSHDNLGVGCTVAQRSDALLLNFSGDAILSGTVNRTDSLFSSLQIDLSNCEAKTPHGFLGSETAAVGAITTWMDDVRAALPVNTRPKAKAAKKTVKLGDTLQIDLAKLAKDADGDPLTFSLPHATSSRGVPISLGGAVVSYTPALAGIVDGLVYVVDDGKGGRAANVVAVKVKP